MTSVRLLPDRRLGLDVSKSEIRLFPGEETLSMLKSIEDVKSGELGTIIFSNLRLIWFNNKNPRSNISIGFDCVEYIEEVEEDSRVKGKIRGVKIRCKFEESKYEFIFNNLNDGEKNIITSMKNILKIYEESRLYRDIKVKCNITDINTKSLLILPDEHLIDELKNVNYYISSSSPPYIGKLITSNIRMVWLCEKNENFSLSIPYISIEEIVEEEGKITVRGNTYFKREKFFFSCIKIEENKDLTDTLLKRMYYYNEDPLVSIDIKKRLLSENNNNNNNNINNTNINNNSNNNNNNNVEIKRKKAEDKLGQKFEKIIQSVYGEKEESTDTKNEDETYLAYLIGRNKAKQDAITDIEYNESLGLACEKLPNNITVENLWKIIK